MINLRSLPRRFVQNQKAVDRVWRFAVVGAAMALLAGCDGQPTTLAGNDRANQPIPGATLRQMADNGMTPDAPILIRTYKKEAELEIWKMKDDGHYGLLKSFPMCRWSGQLGPKTREGDRQVPEGFYEITPGQMNPNSNYYLSFNVGYPNAYDAAHGDTGGDIMVHGVCSSAGCFSMTDEQIAEIYAIAREAFRGGQRAIQMQSMPFHMTPQNLAKYRLDPNIAFWKKLKEGADHFDVTGQEVKVGVCSKQYVFGEQPADPHARLQASAPCPALTSDPTVEAAVAQKEHQDDATVADLVSRGTPAVRTVYSDGGQNPEFAYKVEDDVSRPDALASGGVDIPVTDTTKTGTIRVASATPAVAPNASSQMAMASPAETAAITPASNAPVSPFGSMFSHLFHKDDASTQAAAAVPIDADSVDGAGAALPAHAPLPPRRHAASASAAPKHQASLGLDAVPSSQPMIVAAAPADTGSGLFGHLFALRH